MDPTSPRGRICVKEVAAYNEYVLGEEDKAAVEAAEEQLRSAADAVAAHASGLAAPPAADQAAAEAQPGAAAGVVPEEVPATDAPPKEEL